MEGQDDKSSMLRYCVTTSFILHFLLKSEPRPIFQLEMLDEGLSFLTYLFFLFLFLRFQNRT